MVHQKNRCLTMRRICQNMMRTHCSLSLSVTKGEPSLPQAPSGPRSYPVRNRRPPNILCYDHLGNPSYHPNITLRNPATTASVTAYSPWLSTVPYITFALSLYLVTPYQVPVYQLLYHLCQQTFTIMCHQWLFKTEHYKIFGVWDLNFIKLLLNY